MCKNYCITKNKGTYKNYNLHSFLRTFSILFSSSVSQLKIKTKVPAAALKMCFAKFAFSKSIIFKNKPLVCTLLYKILLTMFKVRLKILEMSCLY